LSRARAAQLEWNSVSTLASATSFDDYRGYFRADPAETFRRHVWINPFWEDDVREVVALMGADRVIFGSDWPHIEGMPKPLDYLDELREFDADAKRKILRDNAVELNRPPA